MKKMIAMLLAAMMLLGLAGTALAYDEEIRWQDIPWGCSTGEVKYFFILKNGMVSDEAEIVQENGYNQIFLMDVNGSEIDMESIDQTASYIETISLDRPNIRVCGYEVKRICFIFVSDGKNTQLETIGIAFAEKDIYASLQEALSSAYGEGEINKDHFGNEYILVKGSNNTAVSLFKSSLVFNETILYGKLDAYEMVQAMINNSDSGTEEKAEFGL